MGTTPRLPASFALILLIASCKGAGDADTTSSLTATTPLEEPTVSDVTAPDGPWFYAAIPYTDWSYDPFEIELQAPATWPTAPEPNYYFVEPEHPEATDTIDLGELEGAFGRLGYPDKPRLTIPADGWIGDEHAAGTVIWLKGGTHGADNFHATWRPQFHGTEDAPVWLYGDPTDKPTFSDLNLQMYNSSHLIIDNIEWIGNNAANGVLSLSVSDRDGPTHHVTLRNLLFQDLDYIGGGGAVVGISATERADGTVTDVVAYNNVFKNCGGGFDWSTSDGDHHGYKVNGNLGGNAVSRVWIIDNQALVGPNPDPIDGLFKSISGNLVQVGDQVESSGNNHHIYVAGNYQEFARQGLGWTKKSSDVIFSTNVCTDTYALAGGNGQCYGHQYQLGDHNWWINNVGKNSSSGWMHTGDDPMIGSLFVIGNLFYDNFQSESDDNWRLCSGATLFAQYGQHYFVNNTFDANCHGIWADTGRNGSADTLHIYNNLFTNISGTIDPTSRAVTLGDGGGMQIFMENNQFDTYSSSVRLSGTDFASIADLNGQSWANANIEADPQYGVDLTPGSGSAGVNAGTTNHNSGATGVYQLFIDRYSNDPDYPGDPSERWPLDHYGQPRIVNGEIDIGAVEQQ